MQSWALPHLLAQCLGDLQSLTSPLGDLHSLKTRMRRPRVPHDLCFPSLMRLCRFYGWHRVYVDGTGFMWMGQGLCGVVFASLSEFGDTFCLFIS